MDTSDTREFIVSAAGFEGPLELLLEMIEKRALVINDISLAAVADDYAARVRSLDAFPASEAAQFVLVAATLLLIKSKSLLPSLETSEEEEADIRELERRLALYKRVRALSRHIRERFGATPLFAREPSERAPVFAPGDLSVAAIAAAARTLVASFPKPEVLPKKIVEKVAGLEETIRRLAERVTRALSLSFKEFAGGNAGRRDIVVSFLALLELVKQGAIAVRQERAFDDIRMESQSAAVPDYR